MLIFVPMSGFGTRYQKAGYSEPKPLIPVDGAPMIERVLSGFPLDGKYLFAVNSIHAENTPLVSALRALRPQATIRVVPPHKDGPVRTILECADDIADAEDVLVNYCDFGVDEPLSALTDWLAVHPCDGAMTGYRGFHPHSLGPTLYAYMRNEGNRVIEIREKHHFTENKFNEYASTGLYYFKRGDRLKQLSRKLFDSAERVNGEFYVSTLMQKLIEDGGTVRVKEVQHFFQWGTPEDLQDFESWARAMRRIDAFLAEVAECETPSAQVIPMAGRGQRFAEQGYAEPKPLIEVAGRPMVAQALSCLPHRATGVGEHPTLVAQAEHAPLPQFQALLRDWKPTPRLIQLDRVTEGQACTVELGLDGVAAEQPVLIAPCDTGYVYDVAKWRAFEQSDAELVVWCARGHLPALWRPHMYGWLRLDGDKITQVAVKQPVANVPLVEQAVITGTFWFRSAGLCRKEIAALIAANERVNQEFYVDTIARRMVEQGRKVRAFVLDKYITWGTPEELKTFQYWNDVFRNGRPMAKCE
ncbi:MAG TPA: NTP transferase domain-containing protein [Pseudomonadota bacterium]|nr:NTP transferase domain-containing protein [Pseudomonadota bacterium]